MAKANDLSDWEVEDALRTLIRADEIKKDKKLMGKVKELAKQKMMATAKVANGEAPDSDD